MRKKKAVKRDRLAYYYKGERAKDVEP